MPLARVLEPEVMDSEEEARDYDAMGHDEVNASFCADLLRAAPVSGFPGPVLDVGTGTARIPVELCRRIADCRVVAMDLSLPMLSVARDNVRSAGFGGRIALAIGDGSAIPFDDGSFGVVMSNSIVHHIPEPVSLLRELVRLVAPGGLLFVRDLFRPDDDAHVERLVAAHAAIPAGLTPPERAVHERQRDLFEASLRAALRVEEVQNLATAVGLPPDSTTTSSDRHWTLSWSRPLPTR